MSTVRFAVVTAAAFALCAPFAWVSADLVRAQKGVAQREAERTRVALLAESAEYRKVLDARLGEVVEVLRGVAGTVDRTAVRTNRTADAALESADAALLRVSGQVDAVVTEVRALRADASGVLTEAQRLEAASTRAVELLTPQALGLVAAAKVTAGEAAQAARRIDAELPAALLTWRDIGVNVANATDESAATARESRAFMANLAAQTKPLPAWARISLTVAPPVVQAGFTSASWLALRGKQR